LELVRSKAKTVKSFKSKLKYTLLQSYSLVHSSDIEYPNQILLILSPLFLICFAFTCAVCICAFC